MSSQDIAFNISDSSITEDPRVTSGKYIYESIRRLSKRSVESQQPKLKFHKAQNEAMSPSRKSMQNENRNSLNDINSFERTVGDIISPSGRVLTKRGVSEPTTIELDRFSRWTYPYFECESMKWVVTLVVVQHNNYQRNSR